MAENKLRIGEIVHTLKKKALQKFYDASAWSSDSIISSFSFGEYLSFHYFPKFFCPSLPEFASEEFEDVHVEE